MSQGKSLPASGWGSLGRSSDLCRVIPYQPESQDMDWGNVFLFSAGHFTVFGVPGVGVTALRKISCQS